MLLLALACSNDDDPGKGDDAIDPLSFTVDEPGPYNVGFDSFELTYDLLGEDRSIVVNVWYPTEDTDGEGTNYLGFAPDDAVFTGASVAANVHDDGYPVHLHSHGSQGYGGTSAFLMRFFASHGWFAIAPDHTGNTFTDALEPRATSTTRSPSCS